MEQLQFSFMDEERDWEVFGFIFEYVVKACNPEEAKEKVRDLIENDDFGGDSLRKNVAIRCLKDAHCRVVSTM